MVSFSSKDVGFLSGQILRIRVSAQVHEHTHTPTPMFMYLRGSPWFHTANSVWKIYKDHSGFLTFHICNFFISEGLGPYQSITCLVSALECNHVLILIFHTHSHIPISLPPTPELFTLYTNCLLTPLDLWYFILSLFFM